MHTQHCIVMGWWVVGWLGGWVAGWLSVATGLRANVRAAGKPLSRTHQQRQSGPTLT